ncbi:MAG: tRNA-binding protein [Bdellovibrionales bacterium]|nr:tRNA-binding protein [Bdellovibrionales bacterium]NQZ17901.1 tRNA-binding protein [Bdellovibrionales bacterium]
MHTNQKPNTKPADEINFDDFLKVDIRIGTVVSCEIFKEARHPSYVLKIDFGEGVGIKKSSARITEHYECEELIGRKLAAVVNFPPRQIGPIKSEVLVLGFSDEADRVVLFSPDHSVPNGSRLL